MTMADFSISDALGSGFGLLGRRPVSVLVWGLVSLIVGAALPLALFGSGLVTDYLALFRSFRPGMASPPPAQMMQLMAPLQAKMMVLQPIMLVVTLLVQSVVGAAVFRAVLEPRNRGLAYLRLGARELWLVLVNFVTRVLAVILIMALAVAGLIIGFALNAVFEGQHLDWATRSIVFVVLGLALAAVLVGVCVRFSMAWPMTFADGQFRLFESWGLTRGHGWKLFGLALLLAIISIVVVLVFEAVAAVFFILAVGGTHWDPFAALQLMQTPQSLLTPGFEVGLAVGGLVAAYLTGALYAITVAPWAAAYRGLRPPPAADASAVFAEPGPRRPRQSRSRSTSTGMPILTRALARAATVTTTAIDR
jgi:hypothetical protein